MRIIIKTTNIEPSKSTERFVRKKIKSLEKFLKPILRKQDVVGGKVDPRGEAFIEIGKPSLHHRKGEVFYAECQIPLPGDSLRAEAKGEDLRLAVVEVREQMKRQLKEYKEKQRDKEKRARRRAKRKY